MSCPIIRSTDVKKTALCLVLAALALFLAGCGGDDTLYAPSVNTVSRGESEPSEDTSAGTSLPGIVLPDDVW